MDPGRRERGRKGGRERGRRTETKTETDGGPDGETEQTRSFSSQSVTLCVCAREREASLWGMLR